jgi:hypothetical protein
LIHVQQTVFVFLSVIDERYKYTRLLVSGCVNFVDLSAVL